MLCLCCHSKQAHAARSLLVGLADSNCRISLASQQKVRQERDAWQKQICFQVSAAWLVAAGAMSDSATGESGLRQECCRTFHQDQRSCPDSLFAIHMTFGRSLPERARAGCVRWRRRGGRAKEVRIYIFEKGGGVLTAQDRRPGHLKQLQAYK